MGAFKNLTGQKFNRLTVIERAKNGKDGRARWICRCDCGNYSVVSSKCLLNGKTKSCGCLQRERAAEANLKNLLGQKFGRLTVIERAGKKGNKIVWLCRCDCGTPCIVGGNELTSGNTKSCGCLQEEKLKEINFVHGMAGTKLHIIWKDIKGRCFNPNNPSYKNYGGRGITICEEWRNNFKAFYDYVSKLPHFEEDGYSLDRIDNNGNYEPNNLRWADRKTQCNNRRNSVMVEYKGVKMTLSEASEKSCIPRETLRARYYNGDRGDRLFRQRVTQNVRDCTRPVLF